METGLRRRALLFTLTVLLLVFSGSDARASCHYVGVNGQGTSVCL